MGYIEIVEMNENGVTVTPLEEASEDLRMSLWLDIFKLEMENKK